MSGDPSDSGEHQAPARSPSASNSPDGSIDAFVSYASHDAPVANSIVAALEKQGLRCWIAPRDVTPGSHYADHIMSAISRAKVLVLVLSDSALASKHVGKEVERASSKGRPIIALRTDTTPLTPAFEYFLSESQWIEVGVGGAAAVAAKLGDAVRSHADSAVSSGPVAAASAHSEALRRKRWVIWAVAVLFAVVFGYLVIDKPWLPKHVVSEAPVAALASATTPAPPRISEKSIAVLPFIDMSEKHDQEYLGDGMAEEILDLLAKIPGLTVIGRTSSFQFKGKNEDLRAIGTKLDAAHVLEGSVRKSGDQVRITAQLVNARTGAHEWSETYDQHIGNALKLQDAIAASVARALQLTVAPDELNSRATVKDAEAYDLYLRGRHAYDRADKDGLDEAVTLFQRSLDRDPTSTHAAGWLAATYSTQVIVGSLAPAAGFEQARRSATNAIKLDPNNAGAYVAMAWIHLVYDWDWAGAGRELQKAATIAPGDVVVLSGEAGLSAALGRWDDALRKWRAALSQDPLNADVLQSLSGMQEIHGNLREAEATMRRALEIHPTYAYGHYNVGYILLERGDRDGALREMQQEAISDAKQQGLALVYYALGRKADANAALAALIKEEADGSAFSIAQVYAFRGQSDEAMHWLERAYGQKDPFLWQIKSVSVMKRLETDPRYKAFLLKMNLPE